MIFSKTCDYGLRASLYIASQGNDQFISIREIAKDLDISFHFLTKILQILTEKNLMTSFRGPNGGIKLSRPASSITLLEIIQAIEGDYLFDKCLIGLDNCSDSHPCPLHEHWKPLRSDLTQIFELNTLESLSKKIRTYSLRITDKKSED